MANLGERYLLGIVQGFPSAAIFVGDVALAFGEKEIPFYHEQLWAAFFIGWLVIAIWNGQGKDARQICRRSAQSFAFVSFLLPVAAIIIWVTEPSEDPIFPPSLIFGVSLVIGGILGGIGMLVAALNSDEAT